MLKENYQERSQIHEIRDAVNIVDVISDFLPLKKAGTNFKGSCPFHKEKTPSFIVSPQKQIYHCFGCGAGGNVFDFIMQIQHMSFKEALYSLAQRAGVELKGYTRSKPKKDFERFFRINNNAMNFYCESLFEKDRGKSARDYLKSRGLGRKEALDFKIGFAHDSWTALCDYLKAGNSKLKDAEEAGLLISKKSGTDYYDRFRNRIMFPIINIEGNVIGFGGRTLGDDDSKYINSPESPVFPKRSSFYGLDGNCAKSIRENDGVIVVEGYMDLIALKKSGFTNVVATLGTAFTLDHARKIKRFTQNVFVTFDSDMAGLNACRRALRPALINSLNVKVLRLPKGHDPDSFLRENGSGAFAGSMDGARDILDFYIDIFFENEKTTTGKARILEELKEIFKEVPSAFERELFVKRASELTGIKSELFDEDIKFRTPARQKESSDQKYPKDELLLTRFLLEDKSLAEKATQKEILNYFSSNDVRDLARNVISKIDSGQDPAHSDCIEDIENPELKGSFLGILLKDTGFNSENIEKAFDDCAESIVKNHVKKMKKQLNLELKRAESSGDEKRSQELLKQINSLQNKYR